MRLWLKNKRNELVVPPPDVTRDLEAVLPAPLADRPAIFIFSIAKSGSTMLNKAFQVLCEGALLPDTNLPGYFFRKGIAPREWGSFDLGEHITDGYCHRGYRYLPKLLQRHPLLQSRRSILLLRDVRDTATSQYFSKKHEHPVPGRGQGEWAERYRQQREDLHTASIDEQVFKFSRAYVRKWKEYVRHLPIDRGLAKVYRYEDHIFAKKEFFRDALQHLEIEVPERLLDEAVAAVDVLPEKEQVERRARVVRPGNHREKLKPETIERLNAECREYLTALNYL